MVNTEMCMYNESVRRTLCSPDGLNSSVYSTPEEGQESKVSKSSLKTRNWSTARFIIPNHY